MFPLRITPAFYFPSADSTAAVTSGESGFVAGSNRATGFPLRSNRNFVKFHLMSPANCGSDVGSVRNVYSGVLSSPFTDTFDIIGKLTLYFELQNFLISSSVPGSCDMKLFAGTPTITSPRSLYFSYSPSSAVYCGVNPHLLATFTSSTTLPL